MADELRVRLHGLSKRDKLDLGEKPGIEYTETTLRTGAQGEVTVFTVMVTMALIQTVAAYLLRKHDNTSFEEEIEIVKPNGEIERRRIRYRSDRAEPPDKQLLEQIRGPLSGV
jgi:hypothetical protein